MQAIILAAGEGRRLKPFTESIPKVMLPIANIPILEYVVNALVRNGLRKIVIVVGYKKESIMDYFGDGKKFSANIEYVYQDKQLGTGHALLQAKKYIKDRFLVLPGDNIIDNKILFNIINQKESSLLVTESQIPSKYGVVEIEKNIIKSITEKPTEKISNMISTGIYLLNKELFSEAESCAAEGIYDLTVAIQRMIGMGEKIKFIKSRGLWMDAVYPWDLLSLNEIALKNKHLTIAGTIEEGVKIKGDVQIGKDSIIRSGTYIVGPIVIGEGCEIGPNCCLFPSTSIGNNVSIGPFTEIRQSIVMNDVWIGSHCSISHSVIGEGCNMENNIMQIVKKSHVKINGGFIKVDHVGSFIGDDCTIGSSTTIASGKIIGKFCKIEPMKNICTNIDSSSHVM